MNRDRIPNVLNPTEVRRAFQRMRARQEGGGDISQMRTSPTTGLKQMYNPTTGLYHTFYCDGPAGAVQLVFEQTGEA